MAATNRLLREGPLRPGGRVMVEDAGIKNLSGLTGQTNSDCYLPAHRWRRSAKQQPTIKAATSHRMKRFADPASAPMPTTYRPCSWLTDSPARSNTGEPMTLNHLHTEFFEGRSFVSRVLDVPLRIARLCADLTPVHPWALRAIDLVGALAVRVLARATVVPVNIDGVRGLWVRGRSTVAPTRTILHVHGGGFMFGTPDMYRDFAARLSVAANADVLLFDYRHPPQSTVQVTADDCLAVYRWLVNRLSPAHQLIVSGDSAGGNAAIGMLASARDIGLPMPAGLVALSPWLDIAYQHPRTMPRDAFFSTRFARRAASLCADAHGPLEVVRPLDRDLHGLPPTLFQVGSTEPVEPGTRLMAEAMARAGVQCRLQLWDRQAHVFQGLAAVLPEGRAAIKCIARFADDVR